MNQTVTHLDQLDRDIAAAYIALGQARTAWTHSPNARTSHAVDQAEQAVNDLLEQRHTTQPGGLNPAGT